MAQGVGQDFRGQSTAVRIIWSRRAVRHLVAVRDYITKDRPTSATVVAARILKSVELLATQPQIGRPGRVVGTRELVVPDSPYVIPYRVRGESLELIAVFHGRRRWPKKL